MKMKTMKESPSLPTILAIAFFSLSVVGLMISGGLQIYSYSRTQQETIIGKQQIIAQDATGKVSNFILEKISILKTAARLSGLSTSLVGDKSAILENILGSQEVFRHMIFWDTTGNVLGRASRFSQKESVKSMDQFKSQLLGEIKLGNNYISPVYFNELTSEPMIIIGVPDIDVYGDIRSIIAAEMNLKFMWDLMNNIKVQKTGYAYVVDRKGNLIAFKDSTRVLASENIRDIKVVAEFMKNNDRTSSKSIQTYKGITHSDVMGTYIPLSIPDWAVVTELPVAEAYQEIVQNAITSILITLFIALVAGAIGVFLARQLSVPLIDLTQTANRIANGEMELEAKVKGPREVSLLAAVFNKSNRFLTEIIAKAKEITMQLNTSTKEIEAATQEQTSASNQNASGITEVSATLQELTITAKQITKNVGELVFSSEEVITFLQESEKQLEQIVSQLDEVGEISKSNTKEIEELGKRSILINEMVELIKEVASKTNILSINASIEASRSTEGGSGFSVVAAEIRELSKETIDSAKKAEKAAKEIQDFLNSIIKSSTNESEKVITSASMVKSIFNNIEKIIGKINNNYDFTQKIDVSIKQQESGSIQAADTIKQMAEIARQSAETARQILIAVKDIVSFSSDLEKVVAKYNTKTISP
ncbi:MAG: methyl-accepting chemotaxis protein [Spirochaetales bacterium]|nr:methyl-accepting chemotaxis protein [Spirochaetales bacterium]